MFPFNRQHTNSSDSGRDKNMTCGGGGVSIYYSAQSTYIIPLLLDTNSGRSHVLSCFLFFFFTVIFMWTCSDKDIKTFNKTDKKNPTHRKSLPIITHTKNKAVSTLH